MAAKDRYFLSLRCPKCHNQGRIDLVENDHAFAPPETRVEAVSDGFTATAGAPSAAVVVTCKCGANVRF